MEDSNLRPSLCKRDALPAELIAPSRNLIPAKLGGQAKGPRRLSRRTSTVFCGPVPQVLGPLKVRQEVRQGQSVTGTGGCLAWE